MWQQAEAAGARAQDTRKNTRIRAAERTGFEAVSSNGTADHPGGEIVVYEDPKGGIQVDVRLERETVWLSLAQMAELFGRDKSVVSRHLRNVFASGELERDATGAKNATVQRGGGREVVREIEHFNLDAILSVGYGPPNRHCAVSQSPLPSASRTDANATDQ